MIMQCLSFYLLFGVTIKDWGKLDVLGVWESEECSVHTASSCVLERKCNFRP